MALSQKFTPQRHGLRVHFTLQALILQECPFITLLEKCIQKNVNPWHYNRNVTDVGNSRVITDFYLFAPLIPIHSGQSQKGSWTPLVISDFHTPAQTINLQIVLPNSFTFLIRVIFPLLERENRWAPHSIFKKLPLHYFKILIVSFTAAS